MDSVHAPFVVGDLSPQYAAEAATTNVVSMHPFDFRSVYWIPPYEILEERGFKVYLVNARHAKNVPGRKKDETDAQFHKEHTQ